MKKSCGGESPPYFFPQGLFLPSQLSFLVLFCLSHLPAHLVPPFLPVPLSPKLICVTIPSPQCELGCRPALFLTENKLI